MDLDDNLYEQINDELKQEETPVVEENVNACETTATGKLCVLLH